MTIAPPRLPQLLLSALGARPEFRDAMLGDMAEEYYMRAELQGEHAAHAWYIDEALRATPHLMRDGLKNLGFGGIAHVIGAGLKAYAPIVAINAIFAGDPTVFTAIMVFPLVKLLARSITTPNAATTLVVGSAVSVLGGYFAARFGRRAPLLSSAALGVFWTAINSAALLVMMERMPQFGVPAWYNVLGPAIILAGTALGGILRITRAERA
jgi:hypothetical protein